MMAITEPAERFGSSLFGSSDLRGEAALLLASLLPKEVAEDRLLELLRGTPDQTAAAVRIVANRHHVTELSLFAVLTKHPDADVRAAVASVLADWASLGIGDAAPLELRKILLDEPGIRLAERVTRATAQHERSTGAKALLDLLEDHQSATVRKHVRAIRQRWAESSQ